MAIRREAMHLRPTTFPDDPRLDESTNNEPHFEGHPLNIMIHIHARNDDSFVCTEQTTHDGLNRISCYTAEIWLHEYRCIGWMRFQVLERGE